MHARPAGRIAAQTVALFLAESLLMLLPAAGCGNTPPPGGQAAKAPAAVPVRVAQVAQETLPQRIAAIGWVEPLVTVTIRSQVEGQLQEIHFQEGDEIGKGDLLFSIDPRPFEAALRLAQANLARDEATMRDSAQELRRIMDLFAADQASERERDAAQAAHDARVAQVKADEAEVDRAKLELEYCSIRSPIDGRAGQRLVDRGNILKSNETALVVLNQIHPVYVAFSVPEQNLSEIQEQMRRHELRVDAELDDGVRESGALVFVDNQVDRTTGMIRLKGRFNNPDKRLWPGRWVNTVLTVRDVPDTLLVPDTAVQPGQSGSPFVYVVGGDMRVEQRPVRVGITVEGRTQVLAGLTPGETVVTDGQLRLVPGAIAAPLVEKQAEGPATQPAAAERSPDSRPAEAQRKPA